MMKNLIKKNTTVLEHKNTIIDKWEKEALSNKEKAESYLLKTEKIYYLSAIALKTMRSNRDKWITAINLMKKGKNLEIIHRNAFSGGIGFPKHHEHSHIIEIKNKKGKCTYNPESIQKAERLLNHLRNKMIPSAESHYYNLKSNREKAQKIIKEVNNSITEIKFIKSLNQNNIHGENFDFVDLESHLKDEKQRQYSLNALMEMKGF